LCPPEHGAGAEAAGGGAQERATLTLWESRQQSEALGELQVPA
jgi:hypothetical protein